MQLRSVFCGLVALSLAAPLCLAQAEPPAAPAPQQHAGAAGEPHFPPAAPANFTAATPTKADVEAFLKVNWGYDENRAWEVFGIEKTPAPGVSKVTVLVAEKQAPQQIASLTFFITPDGKHLISQQSVLEFGPHPYENNYRMLQQQANGPSRGAAGKQFELVEFADLQCPHCKEAEPIAERLVQDFPQAHFVFENFPLVNVHPDAFKAAAWGQCVAQENGNAAFFKYASSVFAAQNELSGQGAEQALRNAVTATGGNPDKVAACSTTPAAKSAVEASMKLGKELNVDETPMLFIDGRMVPMMAISYDQLKKVIEYQFSLDK